MDAFHMARQKGWTHLETLRHETEAGPRGRDLLPGTLDMLILKAVSLKPLHGYGVLLRIAQISQDVLDVPQGSLYPALYRLEHQGLINAEWGESENKRRAKFYTLTPAGRNAFGRKRRTGTASSRPSPPRSMPRQTRCERVTAISFLHERLTSSRPVRGRHGGRDARSPRHAR
jgi:transcriptional regulator